MNSEEIKKDSFVKSLFNEGGIEQPSDRFTENIIQAVKAHDSVYVYKPIISRNSWLVIAFFGVVLFIYLLIGTPPEGQGLNFYGYSVNIDFSGLLNKIAFSFTLTPILKTAFAALIFFTFFNLIIFELRSRSFFK